MSDIQRTVSPVDGSIYVERPLATEHELDGVLERAATAQRAWRQMPLAQRVELLSKLVDRVLAKRKELCHELTMQMGRPIAHAPGELAGFEERARAMLAMAEPVLSDIEPAGKEGFTRFIRREPLGVVMVLAPWNYPWLTSVNSVIPALAAGNAVVLKHSDQTPLVAERFVEAGREAGLPDHVLQYVHASHGLVARGIGDDRVSFVAFTGSVQGGRAVRSAAAQRFISMGLELGGKDAAYVREDCDFEPTVAGVVDGAMFNAGQSCCSIERVYVHQSLFDRFVEAAVREVEGYVLGDPREPRTTLGPLVRERNARAIQGQIDAAVASGATALVDPGRFGDWSPPHLAPQVLVDVNHEMQLMREETFGPVVGIMKVADDDEAVERMNDSRYGLTASIWTRDLDRAIVLGDRIDAGTVFANRSDYLDPELAWVGVKDSGRGVTLSRLGYEPLTRPKSFHLVHRGG